MQACITGLSAAGVGPFDDEVTLSFARENNFSWQIFPGGRDFFRPEFGRELGFCLSDWLGLVSDWLAGNVFG